MRTIWTPRKEHQGFKDIVHGGLVATVLDEVMVRLLYIRGIQAVTAGYGDALEQAGSLGERVPIRGLDRPGSGARRDHRGGSGRGRYRSACRVGESDVHADRNTVRHERSVES